MPYQVSVGSQVVEFPDSVSQEEAQKILSDQFPPTGEDIAKALQDPNFNPTQEQYKLFEEYNKTKQTDWLQSLLTAADTVVETVGQAGKQAFTTGAAFNPKNYVEGLAQGTAQLYGLVAQSQNPDSPLFKLNNLISGTGTLENRYGQFLEARQFNKDLDAYAKGDMSIMFPPDQINPEFVQGVAMVADPTMFVPGIGQVFGAEKIAAKAVGKAAGTLGKGVQAIARPIEKASELTTRFVTEATGISPEALRGAATTSGVLAATGVGPAIGAIGAVPLVAGAASDVGRALETAGAQLGKTPTRIGALEAVGAIPEANMRQRIIGTVGRYGGDAALRTALAGTAGTLEGAATGGVLGYLSGGEEGAAAGVGAGAVSGALGSLGARGLQTLTGSEAKAARLNDLTSYLDTLSPEKKAAYQSVQDRFGVETATNLMDLESLIKGTRGDIGVELLNAKDFEKQAGVTARGVVPDENSATPRILINVDAMPKVKGDSPIYTLGHELLHALAKTKQFQGDVTKFVENLTGAYVPNPDGTVRLVSEGQYTPAKVEELFNNYVAQLPETARPAVISSNPTAADRARYVGEELASEQVGRILSSQKPDAFLRGFTSAKQNFTDMLLLQEASRVGSKIGQLIERTFGVTPTDSILFPEIKNASPALDAALRRLLQARQNIDEALLNADYQKSFKIDQKTVLDPVAADYAVRGGFAERLPTGEVRLLTNGELLQRENRDVTQLKQVIDNLPGAKIDINGEVVGDLSPEQLQAIKGSSVSSQMQQRLEMANKSINEGRGMHVEYYPATEKKQNPQSKKWRSQYASRRVTFREMAPYSLLLSKENNAYLRAIDLTQVRKSLQRSIRPDGSVGGLWKDVGSFMSDLRAYLSNLDRKENAIPSRKLFGPDKAEFFGNFMNSVEKGGSEFIHSFRLDRMGQMDPSDFRAKFSESAYQKMKSRFMPAGTVGDSQAWKSGDGFTILSKGTKFRLYGPDGKLIGIYDTPEQAQNKSYAAKARVQPEVSQLQYQTRNEVRQTAEAGGGNRPVGGTQGRAEGGQALGQVRQAGDVGARFMPSDSDYLAAVQSGDTAKAQELVDNAAKSAGYTIGPVYHGSPTGGFTEFKDSPSGLYFTDKESLAEGYTYHRKAWLSKGKLPTIYQTHINLENPLVIDAGGARNNNIPFPGVEYKKTVFGNLPKNAVSVEKAAVNAFKMGHDGLIVKNVMDGVTSDDKTKSTVFVVKRKEQAKSSEVVTKDDFGNVIPLSQRFQKTNPDLRFMPSDSDYMAAVNAGDTAKAQQMVDQAAKAAGYTVGPVYHGTSEKFWSFDPKQRPGDTASYGEGLLFFTNSQKLANEYASLGTQAARKAGADRIKAQDEFDSVAGEMFPSVSLDYLETSGFNVANEALQLGEITRSQYEEFSRVSSNLYQAVKKQGELSWPPPERRIVKAYLKFDKPITKDVEGGPVFASWNIHLPEMFNEMKQSGSDGFIARGVYDSPYGSEIKSTIYAVKDPSQIKSADPITYDNSGNVIPLSQRFQQSSADIRYMPDAGSSAQSKQKIEVLNKQTNTRNKSRYYNIKQGNEWYSVRVSDHVEKTSNQDVIALDNLINSVAAKKADVGLNEPHKVNIVVKKAITNESDAMNIISQALSEIPQDALFRYEVPNYGIVGNEDIEVNFKNNYVRYASSEGVGWKQQALRSLGNQDPRLQPDPTIPGAYSMSGYRVLPGKSGGRMRVYSPDGSLVGIASSTDEAQRLIQKKLR